MEKGQGTRWFWSALGVAEIVWAIWEISSALQQNPTLLGNVLGHAHAIPIYGGLASGGAFWLFMWNFQATKRFFARRRAAKERLLPENQFRRMELMLRAEFSSTDPDPLNAMTRPSADRFIEREKIRRELLALGIRAPDANSSDEVYYNYPATLIPMANAGDVEGARRFSVQFEKACERMKAEE